MSSDLETQCLENGLLIEEIPIELRTEDICINALKWGLQKYKTDNYLIRREMCARIMNCFPKEILISGFVRGHLSHYA